MSENQPHGTEVDVDVLVTRVLRELGISEPASSTERMLSRDQLKAFLQHVARRVSDVYMDALIDDYEVTLAEIHERFGYVENWRSIPIDLDDKRECWWFLREDEVVFGDEKHPYDPQGIADGHCFINEIYKQRFLKKWVYETDTHTMICVDTHTDGNKFLQIFRNSNRKPALDGNGNTIN